MMGTARNRSLIFCIAALMASSALPAFSQTLQAPDQAPIIMPEPAAAGQATLQAQPVPGQARKSGPITFSGYVPGPRSGMVSGGQPVPAAQAGMPVTTVQSPTGSAVTVQQDAQQNGVPGLTDNRTATPEQIDAFNQIIQQTMPMTPDMIRQAIALQKEAQRAMLERPEPKTISDTGIITLEPGEVSPTVYLSPNMASVIGFYDSTGQPWPIVQHVLGSGNQFQIISLGEGANSVTVTPLVPVGYSNLVVQLKGESKPAIVRLVISESVLNDRRDIQVMKEGPNALVTTATGTGAGGGTEIVVQGIKGPEVQTIKAEAGNRLLMAALNGAEMPESAKQVSVTGVPATAWLLGKSLFIRTRFPLQAPTPINVMTGPGGVRVYEIKSTPTAMFDVNGAYVRADIDIP